MRDLPYFLVSLWNWQISVAAIMVFKIGWLIYYKTVKCNKWRPQKVSGVQSIFIASIPNKKCWNPVFWLVVKILFLNNLILRNTFFKNEHYFSFPAAIHFLYTIIRACDLWEKSSRRESFRGTSYWKIVFSTIFSGWFSEISKDHLWMAASVIKICSFWWKMLLYDLMRNVNHWSGLSHLFSYLCRILSLS